LKAGGKQEGEEREQIALTTVEVAGTIVRHMTAVMTEVVTLEATEVAINIRKGKHLPILEPRVDAFFLLKLTYMIPLHY